MRHKKWPPITTRNYASALYDKASAQSGEDQDGIAAIGGGPNNLPRLRRDLEGLRTQVAPLGVDVGKASAAMGVWAGRADQCPKLMLWTAPPPGT